MDADQLRAGYAESLAEHRVPEHLREGLIGHVVHGRQTGGFLFQLLSNNLLQTLVRAAPDLTLADITATAKWLFNETPAPCWGSEEAVNRWKDQGGEAGR